MKFFADYECVTSEVFAPLAFVNMTEKPMENTFLIGTTRQLNFISVVACKVRMEKVRE